MKVKPLSHGNSAEVGFSWTNQCVNPIRATTSWCQVIVDILFSEDFELKELIIKIELVPFIKSRVSQYIPGTSILRLLTAENVIPLNHYISQTTISMHLDVNRNPCLAENLAVTVQYNMNGTYSEEAIQLPSTKAFYNRHPREAVPMNFANVPRGTNIVAKLVTTAIKSLHQDIYDAVANPRQNPPIRVKVDLFYNEHLDAMYIQVNSNLRQTLRLQLYEDVLIVEQMFPGDLPGKTPLVSFDMTAPEHSPIKPAHFVISWIKCVQYYYQFNNKNPVLVWTTLLIHLSKFAIDAPSIIPDDNLATFAERIMTANSVTNVAIDTANKYFQLNSQIRATMRSTPANGATINFQNLEQISGCIIQGMALATSVSRLIQLVY
ncbi:hypothetical protein BCR33DRAFT_819845 [Rhizoclosmatium globosum]|uniref:Uncharacterized protein n=1 Tax=Rhizoclosmatium globosum TaxID=329046 RepID=A0A1Y2CAD5_9FUNG|nr:hypothetical protein BCR33DRAFT_819845 [Rhizoclosmatium globosum]|eukprot:ORY43295.1 hypothetical protein BCR33DRAFT_819845 [Rhizoclosmatium globosum]